MKDPALNRYSVEEVQEQLKKEIFPVRGITMLGAAAFEFKKPSNAIAVALHAGSRVRSGLNGVMQVGAVERSREEDLYTDALVEDFPLVMVARDSRFEYDLNWEEAHCIYDYQKKKWGHQVWSRPLTKSERDETIAKYREFHRLLDMMIEYVLSRVGPVLLFDIHSFCYQREDRVHWWTDNKPEINVGTRYIHRDYFAAQVEAFMRMNSGIILEGKRLRIAENEIFPGGFLTRKYAAMHPHTVCVLAVEYKKIYMDEWSGKLYPEKLDLLKRSLLLTKDQIPRIKG